VFAHDAMHNIEPQARAFSHFFGGEKRIEDSALDLWRYT
jgi:hypothetical protein